MNMRDSITLFAESGYMLDPDVCAYFCQIPDESVKSILTGINARCPTALVITPGTLVDATRGWYIVTLRFAAEHQFKIGPVFAGIEWETAEIKIKFNLDEKPAREYLTICIANMGGQ